MRVTNFLRKPLAQKSYQSLACLFFMCLLTSCSTVPETPLEPYYKPAPIDEKRTTSDASRYQEQVKKNLLVIREEFLKYRVISLIK